MKDAIKTAKEQFKNCTWYGSAGEALPARHVAQLFAEINRLRNEAKSIQFKLGQTEISLDHKTTLLGSCEKALADRDKKLETMDLKLKDGFRHEERLGDRVQELKLQRFARFSDQECWIYTGEDDDLESLVCPVVIDPKTLIEIIQTHQSKGEQS